MKANELRIGNYIEYCDELHSINYVDIENLVFDELNDAYKPVPLTEEWLVKFGFSAKNYSGHNAFHIINTWEIGNIFINQYDWGFKTDFLRDCDIELKHVHQLQNLYFDLTGQELTITNLS